MLDVATTKKLVDQYWAGPTLVEYIKIPNKSPSFDPDWAAHGYMDEPHPNHDHFAELEQHARHRP
jgi:hypothetical protein